MAMSAGEVDRLLAEAEQRAAGGWMPPQRGEPLTPEQPDMTTGVVDIYLAFYSWVWQGETPPEETERVTELIRARASDPSLRTAVLARCALMAQILWLSSEEQAELLPQLAERFPVGVYPEVDGE